MDFREGASNISGAKSFLKSGSNHRVYPDRRHSSHSLVKTTVVFTLIAIACLLLNGSDYPTQLVLRSYSFSWKNRESKQILCSASSAGMQGKIASSVSNQENVGQKLLPSHHLHQWKIEEGAAAYGKDESILENTLRKAAMKDHKTVIITTLNAAWTKPGSIFDLFLQSFRMGNQTQSLLQHLLVVALDHEAHSRCMEVAQIHCFKLEGVDFSEQAYFMSPGYLKMMWRRINFLRSVLEMGYNFIFTDADVMWLRNPFPRFHSEGDFQIACDFYKFNSTDLNNLPNGGFTYVKSNNRTIQFYRFWYNARDYFPRKHDQDVFNLIKFNPFIARIGLQIRFLNTAYFGGFCQPSKDLDLVVTMHANCCIVLENKISDIKMVMTDWKKYMALAHKGYKNMSSRTWTGPWRCGMKRNRQLGRGTRVMSINMRF